MAVEARTTSMKMKGIVILFEDIELKDGKVQDRVRRGRNQPGECSSRRKELTTGRAVDTNTP